MLIPLIKISPSVGEYKPDKMCNNVDLPHPEKPTIATLSPELISRLTFFKIKGS